MNVTVRGMPLTEWRYTLPEWWCISYHELLQRIPTDGTARLLSGPPLVVEHLAATGKLAVNVIDDDIPCDMVIRGICFACREVCSGVEVAS
jgi:hypothetical protein